MAWVIPVPIRRLAAIPAGGMAIPASVSKGLARMDPVRWAGQDIRIGPDIRADPETQADQGILTDPGILTASEILMGPGIQTASETRMTMTARTMGRTLTVRMDTKEMMIRPKFGMNKFQKRIPSLE